MKSYLPAAAFGFILTAAAFGFGAATAHASTNDYVYAGAGQVVSELRTAGYAVQINGETDGDLTGCLVTGVEGLTTVPSGTAYVDVDCLSGNE